MGWFEGMLGGFAGRKSEVEAQNLAEAQRSQQRESKILEALINSPDPDIQSLAVTGLLHSAQPMQRKSGLRGWIGEMQSSPYLSQIQGLLGQSRQVTEETGEPPTLPSQQTQGYLSTVPGQQPAALPGTSSVDVGAPPPSPVESRTTVTPSPSVTPTRTTMQPRRVFRTPEEQVLLSKRASAQGDVEGEVAGLVSSGVPQAEAREVVKQRMLRRGGGAAGYQSIAGEVTDPDTGQVVPVNGAFDKATGRYIGTDPDSQYYGIPIPGFRSRATGTGANYRYGQDREAIAMTKYGKPFGQLSPAEASDVMIEERKVVAAKAGARVTGAGVAKMGVPIDVSTAERTGTTVGQTSAAYAGERVGTPQERDRRIGVENIREQLGRVKSLLAPLPKAGELGELAPGAALALRRRSPQHREAIARLESSLDNIVNSLARSVGEQRGTQTEQDAERAYNTVVSLRASLLDPLKGDTQESAGARIEETLRYLDVVLSRLPGAPVANRDVGTAPPGVGGPPPPAGASPPAPGPVGAPPPAFTPANFRPNRSRGGAAGVNTPVPGLHVDLSTGQLVSAPR